MAVTIKGFGSDWAIPDPAKGKLDERYAGKAGLPVNVKDPKYGYVKGEDNTAAIESAWADATATYSPLYFPAGDYRYNGVGLSGINPIIHGAGRQRTKIILGATSRLFDTSGTLGSLDIGGFTVIGGIGMFRSTNTGNNVGGAYRVTNIEFQGYTGAAIENNAIDMPYWKFRDLVFDAANFTSTIGIALSGLTDGCSFENIEFLRNRVHIKMRFGGNNAYIRNCDFLRFGGSQGQPRVDIWLVPRTQFTNSGAGFTVESCKFGAENLHAADKRVVYADESAGATNGVQFPVLDAPSTGYITGHNIRNVMNAGVTGAAFPVVFSTTPRVRGCTYTNLNLQGTLAQHVVEFLNTLAPDRSNTDNIIGPVFGSELALDSSPAPLASNVSGFAHIVDPAGYLSSSPGAVLEDVSGTPAQYRELLRTPTAPYVPTGTASLTTAVDSLGGEDARTATFAAGASGAVQIQVINQSTTVQAGRPAWVEFDAKGDTFTQFRVRLEQSGGTFHFSRVVRLGAGWQRYRFQWTPRTAPASGLYLKFEPTVTTGGVFHVGRARVYHSQEPLNVDGLTVIGGAVYRLSVTDGAVTATPVA